MARYSFKRLGADKFEEMVQALVEKGRRNHGELIQFGAGADGAREATWSQPPGSKGYCRPVNEENDVPKEWVFQVKYHDIDLRGWQGAREAVLRELDDELDKVVNKYKVPCHCFVMITNVPLTGVRGVGSRDRATSVGQKWKERVPEVMVWDAADLSRMLDADTDVRTAYIDTILPGDMLQACFNSAMFKEDRRKSAFKAYLNYFLKSEAAARAEEAGDDTPLPLAEIFIDLSLKLDSATTHESVREVTLECLASHNDLEEDADRFQPPSFDSTPASFALLTGAYRFTLILGGPGSGKSTLTQFLALYHAASFVNPERALHLAGRLKLLGGIKEDTLQAYIRSRYPIRIELRRYARWLSDAGRQGETGQLALYIAEKMINPNTGSTLKADDIFWLVAHNPILLILDGLDEVANLETRNRILKHAHTFCLRADAEEGDLQVVMSCRPKGYNGEFEGFEPIRWNINELDRNDFDSYCKAWLSYRIPDSEECNQAQRRVERGMKSSAVQKMAMNLLQATVILTIVRGKRDIPIERHKLYEKYVEVIFEREKLKWPLVARRSEELKRLHEHVGYELHKKMEQEQARALDAKSFRLYVLQALENYSAEDLDNKTLKEAANEIITAATDRLCFLTGQGEEQAEIDFVIQSFREYFAAEYLSNHSKADPEKVFQTLVRRGAYWANVLQFYVAGASPAQQFRWVASIDGVGLDMAKVPDQVELIRSQRALLNVLPEFRTPAKTDFKRAIGNLFSPKTRWGWGWRKSAVEILRVLRDGNAWRELYELFDAISSQDFGGIIAELFLLVPLVSKDTPEGKKVSEKLQKSLSNDSLQREVLAIVMENGHALDLSAVSLRLLEEATRRFFYNGKARRLRKWVKIPTITAEKQLAFMMYSPWLFHRWYARSENTVFPVTSQWLLNFSDEYIRIGRVLGGGIAHYLNNKKRLSEDQVQAIQREISYIGTPYSKYLLALLDAFQNQEDLQADRIARKREAALPHSLYSSCDIFLGPPETMFAGEADWLEYKRSCRKICRSWDSWEVFHSSDVEWIWLLLVFDPRDWDLLVTEGLLVNDDYKKLMGSPIYDYLIKQPHRADSPITITSKHIVRTVQAVPFPLKKMIRVALKIAKERKIEHLKNSSLLKSQLLINARQFPSLKWKEAEELIKDAILLEKFPDIWKQFVFFTGISSTDVDFNRILEYWSTFAHPRIKKIPMRYKRLNAAWNRLIIRLLSNDSKYSFSLAAWLASNGKPEIDCQQTLIPRLCSVAKKLDKSDPWLKFYMSSFEYLDRSTEELELWVYWGSSDAGREIIRAHSEMILGRLKHENFFYQGASLTGIRESIDRIIDSRHNFPPEIPIAALEILLKLDESELFPFKDEDWQ